MLLVLTFISLASVKLYRSISHSQDLYIFETASFHFQLCRIRIFLFNPQSTSKLEEQQKCTYHCFSPAIFILYTEYIILNDRAE